MKRIVVLFFAKTESGFCLAASICSGLIPEDQGGEGARHRGVGSEGPPIKLL